MQGIYYYRWLVLHFELERVPPIDDTWNPSERQNSASTWVVRLCTSAVFSYCSTALHSAHTHTVLNSGIILAFSSRTLNFTGQDLFFFFFSYLFFSNSWHAEILWSHWFVAPGGKWCWSSVGGRSPASLTSVTGKNTIHKDQKVIYKGHFKWRIVQQDEHRTGVGFDSLQEELWPCLCDF